MGLYCQYCCPCTELVTDGVDNPLPHLLDVSEHGRSAPAGALLVAVAPGAEDALQLPHPFRGQAHQR